MISEAEASNRLTLKQLINFFIWKDTSISLESRNYIDFLLSFSNTAASVCSVNINITAILSTHPQMGKP